MKFRVNDPSISRPLFIDAPLGASDEDKLRIYNNLKKGITDAQLELADYGRGSKRKFEDNESEKLQSLFSKGLGLSDPSEFSMTEGLGFKDRFNLSFLPTETDKLQFLQKKFGRENVTAIEFRGKPSLVFKDPEDEKFKLVDEYGASLSDFFADTASEAAPIVASAGILAAPFTGGASLLATAALTSTAYVGTKAFQDIAARGLAGDDIELGDITKRRLVDLAFQAPIDLATLKAGRLISGLIPKDAGGLVAKEMQRIRELGFKVPKQITSSARDKISTAQTVASKRPDGALAKNVFGYNRELASKKIKELFSGDLEGSVINKYRSFIDSTQNQYKRIKDSLRDVRNSKTSVSGRALNTTEKQIERDVTRNVNNSIRSKTDRLSALEDQGLNPVEGGFAIQRKVFDNLFKINKTKNSLYASVEDLMQGVSVPLGSLRRSLMSTLKKIDDPNLNNQILSSIRPTGTTRMLITSIDELPNQSISNITYKQLDNMVKAIDDKLPYGNAGKLNLGEEKVAALQQLRTSLDALRSRTILKAGGTEAKRAYTKANNYFKQTVLPFRQRFDDVVNLQDGQNLNKILKQFDDFSNGTRKTPPKVIFSKDGSKVINEAFDTPEKLARLADQIGSDSILRSTLRKKWLESKKIQANTPSKGFQITDKDKEIIKILWNKSKVKDFEIVSRQLANKKGIIDFKTNRLFRELSEPFEASKASDLAKLVRQELELSSQLDFFDRDLLGLIVKGNAPIPESVGGFSKIILGFDQSKKLTSSTVDDFVNAIGGRNSVAGMELQEAMFAELIKRSNARGTSKTIQEGTLTKELWDPLDLNKLLTENKSILQATWGKEKLNKLIEFNNAMAQFSVKKLTKAQAKDVRVGTAISANARMSLFLTAIPDAVSTRLKSALWSADAFNWMERPIVSTVKGSLNASETFAKLLEGRIKLIMSTEKGIQSMFGSSDSDPLFDGYLSKEYMKYLEEADLSDLNQTQEPAPMQ